MPNMNLIGETTDFSRLKPFIDYGLNKTLINLKIRRLADVKVREILKGEKPKGEKEWLKYVMIFGVIMVLAFIGYQMLSQSMDNSGLTLKWTACEYEKAVCQGQLTGSSPGIVKPEPTNPGNTITG